jgi:hypothetical protein
MLTAERRLVGRYRQWLRSAVSARRNRDAVGRRSPPSRAAASSFADSKA